MGERGAVEIGEAQGGDVEAAVALLAAQLAEHAIELPPAALARAVRAVACNREFGRLLVARDGDRVVGVALVSFLWTLEHGGAAAWLDELYVAPAARGRGIGRALAEAAIAAAEAAECIALDLEVEPGHGVAEGLYYRMGFRRHARQRFVLPLARGRAGDDAALATPWSRDARPFASLDHVSLGVADLARARRFYDAALAPLGLVAHEFASGELAYGPPGDGSLQGFAFHLNVARAVAPSEGFRLALRAPSRDAVRRFHAGGLAHGGADLGAPGLRSRPRAHSYAAILADPDGHRIEAVCPARDGERA